MRLYFLSSIPCILKIGGAYFGQVGSFEKFADVPLQDNLFAEFIPQGAHPVRFFLSENLLFSPPDGVELYVTKRGAAIFVKDFPPIDVALKIIAQKRFQNTLITVFKQGETQAVVENGQSLFCAKLPNNFAPNEIEEIGGLFLLKSSAELCVINEKAELLLYKKYSAYTRAENGFFIISPLFDSMKRQSKESYRLEDGVLEREEYSLLAPQGEEHALICYAFFESVLIGDDFGRFLSPELQEKADELKDFLGEFLSIVLCDDEKQIGLVKKRRERVFDVVYYTVEIENGKISDIHT